MKIIKTKFFEEQIISLSKKYPKIFQDILLFEKNVSLEPFSDLGNNFYKYRIKNSSIPVGKRGGFRLIVKVYKSNILPLLIYSKNVKENVTDLEIINALEKTLVEI